MFALFLSELHISCSVVIEHRRSSALLSDSALDASTRMWIYDNLKTEQVLIFFMRTTEMADYGCNTDLSKFCLEKGQC